MKSQASRRGRWISARMAAGISALSCVLVACSDSTSSEASPEETPQESSPAVDSEEAEAVIESYTRLRELQVDVWTGEREVEEAEDELRMLSTDQAFDNVLSSVEFPAEQGVIIMGEPEMAPEVTALNTNSDPPVATLVDCWDTSGMDFVDAETGESRRDPDNNQGVVVTARSEHDDEQWVWTEISTDFERPC